MLKKQINLTGPINGLGYGVACKNIARALNRHKDVELYLSPIYGRMEFEDEVEKLELEALADKGRTFAHDGDSVRLWHQFALAEHIGRGKKVGFPIFELDEFTNQEVHHLRYQDKILVCSKWAADIVREKTGHNDVHVVPLGVNTDIFNYRDNHTKSDLTVFLTMGKWEKRKGHDILGEAFNRAFSPKDNVMLVMATSNPFLNAQQDAVWRKLYKETKMGKSIEFLPRCPTHQEVSMVMTMADCGVFPARGEGWNLELLECMACGLPVITTNFSAHTEFCDSLNSFQVDIDETEVAHDGVWFHGQGNWAKLGDKQIDQIAEYMRFVHLEKQKGNVLVNHAGIDTAQRFSWENSANKLLEALNV